MAGRTWDPRFLFAWPNSRSSIMGAEQAVNTLTAGPGREPAAPGQASPTPTEIEPHPRRGRRATSSATYHSYYLTSDLRDDGLIDPLDTRNTLGMSLSASLNAPIVRTPGGVLRI